MEYFWNQTMLFLLNNNSTTVLISLITILISASLFLHIAIRNLKYGKKQRAKKWKKAGTLIEIIGACITIFTFILTQLWTIVPDIRDFSRDVAIFAIKEAGLKYNYLDFLNDDGKAVYSFSPPKDTVVRKGTQIRVKMLSKDNPAFFTDVLPEEKYQEANKHDIIDIALSTFNTNQLELHLSDTGLVLYPENFEQREIGQKSISGALVQLINYTTNEMIMEAVSDVSGKVLFEKIPDGIYLYKIVREEYDTYYSVSPFGISYDAREKEDELVWGVNLRGKGEQFYSTKFKVQIVDKQQKAIPGKVFEVRAIKKGNARTSYTSIPVYTDDNGYLTLWHSTECDGISNDYYDIVSFELNCNYIMDVVDERGKYISIDGANSKEIYIVQFL